MDINFFYKRVDLNIGNYICKVEVGYMNCLLLIVGCFFIIVNIIIICMFIKKMCYL